MSKKSPGPRGRIAGVPGAPPVPLTPFPKLRHPGFSQMPVKSGLPPVVRGGFALRSALPSAVRGTLVAGNDGHCAASDTESASAIAAANVTRRACSTVRILALDGVEMQFENTESRANGGSLRQVASCRENGLFSRVLKSPAPLPRTSVPGTKAD